MIHASLEDDRERLALLYSYGYRLGTDTDRRINKDYLKRIKLFKARASPVYKSVVFEDSKDIYKDDPLKKCFEYARQARINAAKIQDFTKEYMDIAKNCEEFAKGEKEIRFFKRGFLLKSNLLEEKKPIEQNKQLSQTNPFILIGLLSGLLDRCTTKHEVQTLLQTKSYKGHMDANFNIAILDGHKEFVAHEKFQQLLHKKWGQRDRLHTRGEMIRQGLGNVGTGSYNIFWSEKNSFGKFAHILKQVIVFLLLPFIYIISSLCGNSFRNCQPCNWFILQVEYIYKCKEKRKGLYHIYGFCGPK